MEIYLLRQKVIDHTVVQNVQKLAVLGNKAALNSSDLEEFKITLVQVD